MKRLFYPDFSFRCCVQICFPVGLCPAERPFGPELSRTSSDGLNLNLPSLAGGLSPRRFTKTSLTPELSAVET